MKNNSYIVATYRWVRVYYYYYHFKEIKMQWNIIIVDSFSLNSLYIFSHLIKIWIIKYFFKKNIDKEKKEIFFFWNIDEEKKFDRQNNNNNNKI